MAKGHTLYRIQVNATMRPRFYKNRQKAWDDAAVIRDAQIMAGRGGKEHVYVVTYRKEGLGMAREQHRTRRNAPRRR